MSLSEIFEELTSWSRSNRDLFFRLLLANELLGLGSELGLGLGFVVDGALMPLLL